MSTFSAANLVPGLQATFNKTISEQESKLYAGLIQVNSQTSEDQQDTHHHHLFMIGLVGDWLDQLIPDSHAQCVNIHYEFLSSIQIQDNIETIIELVEIDEIKHLVTYRINCFNQSKNQVITGQAVMLVSR
ncbi:MAG: hypothetical protein JEZ00_14000 [Anaerolineaceae bacterium]|nr:hypothetical protein [Anaerolineaceae bacterium]